MSLKNKDYENDSPFNLRTSSMSEKLDVDPHSILVRRISDKIICTHNLYDIVTESIKDRGY